MKTTPPSDRPFRPGRHLEILDDPVHDPYQAHFKAAPSLCRVCGAVWQEGRWQWGDAPAAALVCTCPACQRIRDQRPAGYVSLEAPLSEVLRAEALRMVRHLARLKQAQHPLQRIMAVKEHDARTVITTTDVHLAQDIGAALERAYQGRSEYTFSKDEHLLRVRWHCG